MILYKKDVTPAAESLQFSADQRAGAETLIHVMTDIFAWYGRSFLIGTENPFNSVNRKVLSHNLKFICPIIATCIVNCYANPSRLFIVCGGEINSSVGPTQGDLTSIGAYTLVILPLIIKSIKDYWDKLTAIGPKYGYFSKSTKSLLIVKEINFMDAQNL